MVARLLHYLLAFSDCGSCLVRSLLSKGAVRKLWTEDLLL
jgi:hypothetical protein